MGCAMGTICAPPYANIIMAQFEAKNTYPYIHGKAMLFVTYFHRRYFYDLEWNYRGTNIIHR